MLVSIALVIILTVLLVLQFLNGSILRVELTAGNGSPVFLDTIDITTNAYYNFPSNIFFLPHRLPFINNQYFNLIVLSILLFLFFRKYFDLSTFFSIQGSIFVVGIQLLFTGYHGTICLLLAWTGIVFLLYLYGYRRGAILAGFTIFTILILNLPLVSFPDYPPDATVVQDDGLPGKVRPLIGRSPSIEIIDRHLVKSGYAPSWIAVGLFLCFLYVYFRYEHKDRRYTSLVYLSALTFVVLALDTLLPESIAILSPLLSFSRIIPSFNYLSLTPLAYILCLDILAILLFIPLTGNTSFNSKKPYLPVLLVLISLTLYPQHIPALPAFPEKANYRYLVSPSYQIVSRIPENKSMVTNTHFKELPPGTHLLSDKQQQSDIQLVIDHNPATRWSLYTAKQTPGDYFILHFPESINLSGLELQTGEFFTDFGRGLRIQHAASCERDKLESADFQTITDTNPWLGSLNHTPSGFPYYGNQSEVKLYFPSEINARCLKVIQTGKEKNYDWSVAEIKIGTLDP